MSLGYGDDGFGVGDSPRPGERPGDWSAQWCACPPAYRVGGVVPVGAEGDPRRCWRCRLLRRPTEAEYLADVQKWLKVKREKTP